MPATLPETPDALRGLRAGLGLSQAAMAKTLGVHTRTYKRYELGEAVIPRLVGLACLGIAETARHGESAAETILKLLSHVKALEAHYHVPEASRLSTGSQRATKAPTAAAS